jgi:DNA-binding XRE family transcriptional regulator
MNENERIFMHNNSLGRDLIPKGKRDFVIDVDFGEKVTWRRKNLQISQKELATVVGVSVNTIQSYEQGHLPRGSNFVTLAKIL